MLTRGLDRLVERGELRVQEMVDTIVQGNGFSSIIAKVRKTEHLPEGELQSVNSKF